MWLIEITWPLSIYLLEEKKTTWPLSIYLLEEKETTWPLSIYLLEEKATLNLKELFLEKRFNPTSTLSFRHVCNITFNIYLQYLFIVYIVIFHPFLCVTYHCLDFKCFTTRGSILHNILPRILHSGLLFSSLCWPSFCEMVH